MESGTFYFSGVLAGVLDAKRKRDDTVSRLQEFDATQTAALLLFEQDMQTWWHVIAHYRYWFRNSRWDYHQQIEVIKVKI